MQESQIIGHLFNGAISYQSQENVYKFIDNIQPEQAFFVITQALNMAYAKGVFDLTEAEILSKSLRILTQKKEPEQPSDN
jgi:hypothetical protein